MKKEIWISLLGLIIISCNYQPSFPTKTSLGTVFAFDACPSEFLETDGSIITFSGDAVPAGYGHISYFNTELKVTCSSNQPFNCLCNDTVLTESSFPPICCSSEKFTETFNIKTQGIPDHFARIFTEETITTNTGDEEIVLHILKELQLDIDIPTCPHKYLPSLTELPLQDNSNPRTLNAGIVGISILGVPIYSPFTYNSNTNNFQYVMFDTSKGALTNVNIPTSISNKYSPALLTLDTCQGYVSTSSHSSSSKHLTGEYRYHTGPICTLGSKYLEKDDCRYFQRQQGKGYCNADCKPQGWTGANFQNDDTGTFERYIVGYAVDGFPIYAASPLPTENELDNCNGKFDFNEETQKYKYAYYVTTNQTHAFWPYTIGCFGPGTHYKNGQEINYAILGIDTASTVDKRCEETPQPTNRPTLRPTQRPTISPTTLPTALPTKFPTSLPTSFPTTTPTALPTTFPTSMPTSLPTHSPTSLPTSFPTERPTSFPTSFPTIAPTAPTSLPTALPTSFPTSIPTTLPTRVPTSLPSNNPTSFPTIAPTAPTSLPTALPTSFPTSTPTALPTRVPTYLPSNNPTSFPTSLPTSLPTVSPTLAPTSPTESPTGIPSSRPTTSPSSLPTSFPTSHPSVFPTAFPTLFPTISTPLPTAAPTGAPSTAPTGITQRKNKERLHLR